MPASGRTEERVWGMRFPVQGFGPLNPPCNLACPRRASECKRRPKALKETKAMACAAPAWRFAIASTIRGGRSLDSFRAAGMETLI